MVRVIWTGGKYEGFSAIRSFYRKKVIIRIYFDHCSLTLSYLVDIDVVLKVLLLKRWRLPTLMREQFLEGCPGIRQAVQIEGVFSKTEQHIIFSQSPPLSLVNLQCLLIRSQTVQSL